MRCSVCGARNPDSAQWCGQCYAPAGPAAATGADPVDGAAGPPAGEQQVEAPTERPTGTPTEAVAPTSAADAAARDVRIVGGDVQWRCARCDGWSPLDAAGCTVCGAARVGFGERTGDRAVSVEDLGRLTIASVLVPGLGHILAGRPGTGVARLVLALVWLVGGLSIVVAAGATAAALPGLPLLAGLGVVWTLTVSDARALALGSTRERLHPRALLWLTAGVVGALVVLAVAGAVLGSPTPAA